jgi:hypothetical protein
LTFRLLLLHDRKLAEYHNIHKLDYCAGEIFAVIFMVSRRIDLDLRQSRLMPYGGMWVIFKKKLLFMTTC